MLQKPEMIFFQILTLPSKIFKSDATQANVKHAEPNTDISNNGSLYLRHKLSTHPSRKTQLKKDSMQSHVVFIL